MHLLIPSHSCCFALAFHYRDVLEQIGYGSGSSASEGSDQIPEHSH